jgi:hypothetical protein
MNPNPEEELRHFQLWEKEEAKADRQELTSYRCPCKKYMGGRVLSRNTIRQHLRQYRRDPAFKTSMLVCPPYPGRAMLCSYSEVECLNPEYRDVDVLQRPHILALASKALNLVLKGSAESCWQGLGRLLTAQESQLLNWRADVYDGQWGPRPIPKLIPFTYWNRL